ncbi:MAG: efflux RND transporter periplasmic adaptor subunit [Clostridia bacterium]|nr:efflux RND transporter periplasmic adaptor subunit [Clostridia bacterium]
MTEGDRVSAGDEILSYRILENDELSLYFRDMLTADAETLVEEGSLAAESGDILAAAEYFSVNGSLPSWFENYYIPVTSDNDTAGEYLILRAGIDGEITKLNVNVGDRVTGVLSSVKIEDKSSFCADIEIPESCIGSVETGQYVAVSGSAFGGKSFPATIISIDNKAKTVDSLLGSGKTVVDGVLYIEAEDDLLISGLTVKCDIFINVWEDAVVVPYSAVCSEGSEEFVWLWNEGKIERRIIHPVYRYSKGAVTVGEFSGDELLVSNCDTILYDGMEIEGELSR